jgi:hypothetical protein
MLEQFVGKKVTIKTGQDGDVTEYGLTVLDAAGTLISVNDGTGKVRVINTASGNFSEITLQE